MKFRLIVIHVQKARRIGLQWQPSP